VPILVFNPLRERGLEHFTNPQSPTQMIAGGTRVASHYFQVKPAGDTAAIVGICKAVIEADDGSKHTGAPRMIDVEFIEQHTHGFEEFADSCRGQRWANLEAHSGLTEKEMRGAAAVDEPH
jgi:anaerobic selenocysteine-containing dehydrogenase